MTRCAVLVLFAAACGGGGTKAVTPPTGGGGPTEVGDQIPSTKGPDCAIVADRLATAAYADAPDQQDAARDKSRTRCTNDKWSDEVRNCFATVETDAEIHGCASTLTDDQQRKLSSAFPDLTPKGGEPAPDSSGASGGSTRGSGDKGGKGTRAPGRDSSDPCEGGEHK